MGVKWASYRCTHSISYEQQRNIIINSKTIINIQGQI